MNHLFHMGDIPNLQANKNGEAFFEHRTFRITISAGPLSVFDENGSAVIIHLNRDQRIPGADGSCVSGGARIACGIIQPTD
jgi:Cu-Zn family superoxide dismutase